MNILFEHAAVVTVDGANPFLRDGYVAVRDTKITAVSAERPEGTFDRVIDASGRVLMPGLVNAHTHVPMSLMRGYGGGHDLQTWLNDYIFPAEDRLNPRVVRAGTALSLAELIACGVTCINDMYYFCDDIIEEVLRAGLNANISRGITCFQPIGDPAQYGPCQEMRATAERYHGAGNGQILVDVSIHGEYTSFSAPNLWEYLGRYAADHHLGMHVHLSETRTEHQDALARHGCTPLQILDHYGVWDCGRSVAAHCVWVTEEDRALMARKHISCAANPVSNLKLGSGIPPLRALLRDGVNVALGTDGPSSNNNQDLFEELKLAAILPCGAELDAAAVSAQDALRMATVNGGKALGRTTGSIRAGWDADLILLDFTRPSLTPCHDAVENIVYAARGSDVCLTMARGQILYENGTFSTLDLNQIRYEVEHTALPTLFG